MSRKQSVWLPGAGLAGRLDQLVPGGRDISSVQALANVTGLLIHS